MPDTQHPTRQADRLHHDLLSPAEPEMSVTECGRSPPTSSRPPHAGSPTAMSASKGSRATELRGLEPLTPNCQAVMIASVAVRCRSLGRLTCRFVRRRIAAH